MEALIIIHYDFSDIDIGEKWLSEFYKFLTAKYTSILCYNYFTSICMKYEHIYQKCKNHEFIWKTGLPLVSLIYLFEIENIVG